MLLTKKNKILLLLSLFTSVLISYLYILNGDFVGDDIDRIAYNPELRSFGDAIFGRLKDRPLLMFIVTFISKVFGTETLYYRLLSIILHSFVAYQIYIFFLELNENSKSQIKGELALFCAFAFALHPLNSQAITTAIQVSVLFTGLLGLLSLRYFFKGISSLKDSNFHKSIFALFLSVLFKPNLSFFPLIYLHQHKKIKAGAKTKAFILLSYIAVILLPALVYVVGKVNVQGKNSTPLTYFLVQAEVLFTYFKLMLAPYHLQFLYDFTIPKNPWASLNWIYVAAHSFIIAIAYFRLPSKLVWSLFLFFYLSFIPESSFFPIDHLAFEHRTYFSLILFILFIGSWIAHYEINESFKRLTKIMTVAVCALFIMLNQTRNAEIKTYGLWAHNTLLNSNSMIYHNYSFSVSLAKAGNFSLVEPIIRSYPKKFPGQNYEVLEDILDYYMQPEKKRMYLNKFIDYVESPKTLPVSKLFLNKILAEDFAHQNDNLDDLIRIENAFTRQLPEIMDRTDRFIETGIKANYIGLGLHLTLGQHKDAYKSKDPVGYLRTKVLLQYYFGQNFDGLQQELENELQKQPNNAILKDLLALLNLKKS